jgi:hypothetical protein
MLVLYLNAINPVLNQLLLIKEKESRETRGNLLSFFKKIRYYIGEKDGKECASSTNKNVRRLLVCELNATQRGMGF